MNKDIMDVKQVAEYLSFSEKKIRNLIGGKNIPYSKIGGQYRFLKQDIDIWLRQNGPEKYSDMEVKKNGK